MNNKLLTPEIIGFVAGVIVVGIVSYFLMQEPSVMKVLKLLVGIYWLDILVVKM